MSARKQNCTNPEIGRLLDDAMNGDLLAEDHAHDRQLFFHIHFEECQECRAAMLDHANELAIIELASDRQAPIEEVLEDLGEFAKRLEEIADQEGISLEGALQAALNEKRELSFSVTEQAGKTA